MHKLKWVKKISIIVGVLILVWGLLAFTPKPTGLDGENPFIIGDDLPVMIAHGGGNHEFPDNTLEAYYHAYSIDPFVMLETDVSITKDGVIILSHDTTLDRKTTLIEAPIESINYNDLMTDEIDFGYENPIEPRSNGFNVTKTYIRYTNYLDEAVTPLDVSYPEGVVPRHESRFLATTLQELIQAFPDNTINVEIKQYGDVGLEALRSVIELMDTLDADYNTYERIVLATFHREIYEAFKDLQETTHPQLMISPQEDGVRQFYILSRLQLSVFFNEPVAVLQVPPQYGSHNLATKNFLRVAHQHNIAVHYWTINDEETMRFLIELGADGIMTDRPTLLKAVLDSYR